MEIMKTKKYFSLTVTSLVLLGSAAIASANVPPPPVNQNLGIADGVFNNLVETQCRACHETPGSTPGFKPGYLPDRHHLLVDKVVRVNSDMPFSTSGASGAAGTYNCLSCHRLITDTATGLYKFDTFRNCLYCHTQKAGTATVHHRTPQAVDRNCKACHGPIDNPKDGHYVPTYQKSLITPMPGIGTGPSGQGGCKFCHNAGTDTKSGLTVYSNANTHHTTGVVLGNFGGGISGGCVLCHEVSPTDANPAIRACEACHGVNSLHNIQVDSSLPKNGVQPGLETNYWGHIGHNNDCRGCHLGYTPAASEFGDAPTNIIMPFISSIGIQGGNILNMAGEAFSNVMKDGTVANSIIKMTGSTGKEIFISPAMGNENALEAVLPTFLQPDNYKLTLVKGTQTANTTAISLSAKAEITVAKCADYGNWATVTITGSGLGTFGAGMGIDGSGVGVTGDGASCMVNSWGANEIVASCKTSCPSEVTVSTVQSSATASVGNILDSTCVKCHGDNRAKVDCRNKAWREHLRRGLATRSQIQSVEKQLLGGTCNSATALPTKTTRK